MPDTPPGIIPHRSTLTDTTSVAVSPETLTEREPTMNTYTVKLELEMTLEAGSIAGANAAIMRWLNEHGAAAETAGVLDWNVTDWSNPQVDEKVEAYN